MGLKTTNYFIEDTGILLNDAYAMIHRIYVDGDYGAADFYIQSDRESALDKAPLDKKTILFEYLDRESNPFEHAYVKAKSDVFKGWEDDILSPDIEIPNEPENPIEDDIGDENGNDSDIGDLPDTEDEDVGEDDPLEDGSLPSTEPDNETETNEDIESEETPPIEEDTIL